MWSQSLQGHSLTYPTGPSECLVLADHTADPAIVAADLLAQVGTTGVGSWLSECRCNVQAEHDVMAVPELVTTDEALVAKVEAEISRQLETLETADVARASVLKNAWACVCPTMESAINVCNLAAPEHLEVCTCT